MFRARCLLKGVEWKNLDALFADGLAEKGPDTKRSQTFSLLYSNSSQLIFSIRSLHLCPPEEAMTSTKSGKKTFQINFYYASFDIRST